MASIRAINSAILARVLGLVLIFMTPLQVGVEGQIYGFDCYFENVWYKNRQNNITLECTFYKPNKNCFCFRGYVTCPGRCTNYAYSPDDECRLVTEYGECCRRKECSKQIQMDLCDNVVDSGSQTLDIAPSWTFLVKTGQGKRCLATLHDWKLFVPSDCANDTTITVLSPLIRIYVPSIKFGEPFPFLNTIHLDKFYRVKHYRKIHEINRPWSYFCSTAPNNCTLFLSSINSDMQVDQFLTMAQKVDPQMCNLTSAENETNPSNFGCLEILTNSTECSSSSNFYGSSVAMKKGQSFYLIGFVVSKKDDKEMSPSSGQCGPDKRQFYAYRDICQSFSVDPTRKDDNFIRRKTEVLYN